jgi:arylformamidase
MSRELIDITRTVGRDTLTYPGDKPAQLSTARTPSGVNRWEVTTIHASCHVGTHLDAPAHLIEGGKRLEAYPLQGLVMEALVIDTGDAPSVQPVHLEDSAIAPDAAVLFRTANSSLSRREFTAEYCHISPAAAEYLVERKVRLVAIDYLSVDPHDSEEAPAHAALLGAGILVLEDADLRQASPGPYVLYCFPLKLADTEAAPCRAALLPS